MKFVGSWTVYEYIIYCEKVNKCGLKKKKKKKKRRKTRKKENVDLISWIQTYTLCHPNHLEYSSVAQSICTPSLLSWFNILEFCPHCFIWSLFMRLSGRIENCKRMKKLLKSVICGSVNSAFMHCSQLKSQHLPLKAIKKKNRCWNAMWTQQTQIQTAP